MSSASNVPQRDFQFFVEIIDAFKLSRDSAVDGNMRQMKVGPFLEAMEKFLRIFDAFSNPFFTEVVKKDVLGNIDKLRVASEKVHADTLEAVIDEETKDPKLLKLIQKESGIGQNTGTVALLWMKRTLQFIGGLLRYLVEDRMISLSSASRKSYSKTLGFCHNMITRGVFDTGLRFAPARETFYKNLTGGTDLERVDQALRDYFVVFEPQVEAIVQLYFSNSLEPLIKAA